MSLTDPAAPPPLLTFKVTYSPSHTPMGIPLDKNASRQVLHERLEDTIQALNVDDAVQTFERRAGRMVTSCKRVQSLGDQS
jgi:hypothetical protein